MVVFKIKEFLLKAYNKRLKNKFLNRNEVLSFYMILRLAF